MLFAAQIIAGIVLLVAGGAALVKGASGVAARFGISSIVIGLTIVAFGTSAPELAVNILAARNDQTDLAFANIVGSNLANLGLVLGTAALFMSLEIHGQLVRRELPLLLMATAALLVLILDPVLSARPARFDLSDALIGLLLFSIFLYVSILDVVRTPVSDPLITAIENNPTIPVQASNRIDWVLIVLGPIGLVTGGNLTVSGASSLADFLGVSTALIGLFLVAIGTSLPELVTSIIAAIRKESDLAVGNVVGSNLFNTLAVLPLTGIISPVHIPEGGIVDLALSFLFALVLIPIFWVGKAHLGRKTGAGLLLVYFGYLIYRFGAMHG